jgi:hypothetical protein
MINKNGEKELRFGYVVSVREIFSVGKTFLFE